MEYGVYLSLFGDLIDRNEFMADIRGMRLYMTAPSNQISATDERTLMRYAPF